MDYEDIGNHRLYFGDCLDVMPKLEIMVDMVLADPPYGTTACKWDAVIPLDAMWSCLKPLTRPGAATVLTAAQPFTSVLVLSNISDFKYDWTWKKTRTTGVLNAKRQPLRTKEDVLVFSCGSPPYTPQGLIPCDRQTSTGVSSKGAQGLTTGKITQTATGKYHQKMTGYPRNVIEFPSESKTVHPTQKPVALMEYLIKTYTKRDDTVLDFTMGSGTTGVACANTGRRFIGIESDPEYFDIACDRVEAAVHANA